MMTSLDISAKKSTLIRESVRLKLRSGERGGKRRWKGACVKHGGIVKYLLGENSRPYKILHEAMSQESDVLWSHGRWPGTMSETCDRREPIIDHARVRKHVHIYARTHVHQARALSVCLFSAFYDYIGEKVPACVKAGASVWHVAGESCGAALRERVIYNCYRETY